MRQESEIERGPTGIRFTWCRIITMIPSAPVRRASRIHVTPRQESGSKRTAAKENLQSTRQKAELSPGLLVVTDLLVVSTLSRRSGFHKTARRIWNVAGPTSFLSLSLTFPIEHVSFLVFFPLFFFFSQSDTSRAFGKKVVALRRNFGARWLYLLMLQTRTLTVE